jgi:hypothetical protein
LRNPKRLDRPVVLERVDEAHRAVCRPEIDPDNKS